MSDYLDWKSNLSAELVFTASEDYRYPQFWQDGIIYLTSLESERGRCVLHYLSDDVVECLTPQPFDLKSKINEYGGKPFWLFSDKLIFVNADDQCLYLQDLYNDGLAKQSDSANTPRRISPAWGDSTLLMYTDVVMLAENQFLAIVERKDAQACESCESESFIALLCVPNESPSSHAQIQILQSGADFYSNLVIDSANKKIAWVQWNHPNMPWDNNELWIADLAESNDGLAIRDAQRVLLEGSASICQLLFSQRGELYFSVDFAGFPEQDSKNYWNIYVADLSSKTPKVTQVTFDQGEYGYPHWQYGDVRIVELDKHTVLSFATTAGGDVLCKIDQSSKQVEILATTGFGYQNLATNGKGSACAVLLSANRAPALAKLASHKKSFEYISDNSTSLSVRDISTAEPFSYPTRDQATAYGYYYAPCNSDYVKSSNHDQAPPLIVMVHGGPTARAYGYFDIQKQFWTQRGFAVVDINHRGSSGQGRLFRDSLYGQWGEVDTSDIIDAIDYLIANGKADSTKICIRGKSAGGYAVLRALTQYPKVFRVGACYYGIGNLATLAASTHKFEKYYTERLIGETYCATRAEQTTSRYWLRSPIRQIERLQSALIVFQGALDKIVPPRVAHELIVALKKLGLAHSYVEYEDEGHGFRQKPNCIDSLMQELKFYRARLR
jgi:dipeptidyl aminopeptidase/acylaminoacyl peptidase